MTKFALLIPIIVLLSVQGCKDTRGNHKTQYKKIATSYLEFTLISRDGANLSDFPLVDTNSMAHIFDNSN